MNNSNQCYRLYRDNLIQNVLKKHHDRFQDEWLQEKLCQLTEIQMKSIYLQYWSNKSTLEISKILKLRKDKVEDAIDEGLEKLRNFIFENL